MPGLSHYDILEVSPRASAEVIRAAYKSLMQRHHPDRNPDAIEATDRTALIAQAYAVLSDPQQRRSYDESLAKPPAAERSPQNGPRRTPVSGAGRAENAGRSSAWRAWYAAALILCIMAAGSGILFLSKENTATAPTRPEPMPLSAQRLDVTAPLAVPGQTAPWPVIDARPTKPDETPAQLQARTISAFVTDLSITLDATDPAQPGKAHVLRIPSLGLRVGTGEPGRFTRRIQAQRAQIIEQLLVTLAKAPYQELINADGDLYLKRQVAEAVIAVVGLDKAATTAAVTPPPQGLAVPLEAPAAPLEVLLPLSFSVN